MDVKCYRKSFKSPKAGKGDKWVEDKITNTINCFDIGDIRTCEIICHEVQMDVNKESHFFETASIFEENWIERNTVNALRNHATGVGMGVLVQMDDRVIGVDAYNFNITGDIACTLNATSCDSPSHSGPSVIVRQEVQMDVMGVDCYNLCGTGSIGRTLATSSGGLNEHIPVVIVLNDQGGSVMDVSNDVTATLRAQDHGHPPVICFEPGIAKREGGADRFVKNKCTTLRANMGDNQPAVCYAIEGNVVDRISAKNGKGWCENISPTLNTQDKHAVCYALEGNGARPSHMGSGYSDDGTMYTLNTIERHSVCYDARGNGDGDVAPTITGDHQNRVSDYTAIVAINYSEEGEKIKYVVNSSGDDIVSPLDASYYKGQGLRQGIEREFVVMESYPKNTWALCAKMDRGLSGQDGFNDMIPVIRSENMEGQRKYILRRLTPMECARLQGFPDWWTDGVEGSDSNKYKMWGNGIALPCAADVIGRIAKEIENDGLQGH